MHGERTVAPIVPAVRDRAVSVGVQVTPDPDSTSTSSQKATHAGGVVYRCVDGEVLYALVQSKDPVPVWVWPTGHLEPGETAVQAAIREVREETGIAARAVAALPQQSFARGGGLATVASFLLEYGRPEATSELRAVAWAAYRDACSLLAHPESVELLRAAQPALASVLAAAAAKGASTSSKDWAAELLMKDYEALTRELEQNEGRGETRLSIYLTIVTAVIAGLVSLSAAKSKAASPEFIAAIGVFALSALLALGIVLFLRILKRDAKTDGFVEDLKEARKIVATKLDPAKLLAEWAPFKPKQSADQDRVEQEANGEPRRIGGLADLVAVINSILVGGIVLIALFDRVDRVGAAMVAVMLAVTSFVLHVSYRAGRERERRTTDQAKRLAG